MKGRERTSVSSYDGTEISFLTEGDGFPLVLCNGILCSIGYWVYLRAFFRSRTRLVLWDYRGHGRSGLPRHPWNVTLGSHRSDLLTVLDAAGVRKAILIGHSMGVQVILEFYRSHPERVAGLIPVCGTYGHPFRTFYGTSWTERLLQPLFRQGERFSDPFARIVKPLLTSPLAPALARLSGSIHWYLCPGNIMKDYFQHLASLDVKTAFRLAQAMGEHSAEDMLERVLVPTLVIAGEKDLFTPVWVAERMATAIPKAELLVMPEGTHTALVENPLLMNLRIEVFLRDHFQNQGYRPLKSLGHRETLRGAPT